MSAAVRHAATAMLLAACAACASLAPAPSSGKGCAPQQRPAGPRSLPGVSLLQECDPFDDTVLPAPVSDPPAGGSGMLQAGRARRDITPPPGLTLFGWGTEAKKAAGHRSRLYARALVLEDKNGEIVAFVTVDLAVVSNVLHRKTAAQVAIRLAGHDCERRPGPKKAHCPIGADRLIIAGTHTHSAPGHFLDAWPHNVFGAPGYDSVLVDSLAHRIADAVAAAYNSRAPAKASWIVSPVWGHTRNRSFAAYRRNTNLPARPLPAPPPALTPEHEAVNPMWTMLRVDVRTGTDYEPAAALSLFAIHGTAMPAGNDLYDPDIPGLVARRLERMQDPAFVHLVANGMLGDVSPDWPPQSRCTLPRFEPAYRPSGPRTPPDVDDWQEIPETLTAACMAAARDYLRFVSGALASAAQDLWQRAAAGLSDAMPITRAFQTVALTGPAAHPGLCPPRLGTAVVAGGPDGRSRLNGWKPFGFVSIGLEPGDAARDQYRTDCQRPKRVMLPAMQNPRIVGALQFPADVQLSVIRIGDVLLGVVPAELTTVAGRRVLAAMRGGTPGTSWQWDRLAILGIANGYVGYVTTPEEYWEQAYEGASNVYGPGSVTMLADSLTALTGSVFGAPTANVAPISVRLGPLTKALPRPRGLPPPPLAAPTRTACFSDRIEVRWIDSLPGDLRPWDGFMVEFTRAPDRAVDDDLDVDVRYLGQRGAGGAWMATWFPPGGTGSGQRIRFSRLRWAPDPRSVSDLMCP